MNDLELVVLTEDRLLKRSVLITRCSANDLVAERTIEIGTDDHSQISWAGGTRVHVAVVLSQDRKREPGLANRCGSWLARKTFRIAAAPNRSRFELEPVPEEFFTSRGLPKATAYLLDAESDLNQSTDDLSTLVRVYVSDSLIAALSRNEASPSSKAMMTSIYADVVSGILAQGTKDYQDPLPGGIIDNILGRLAHGTGVPYRFLENMVREGRFGELRAVVQAEADLRNTMIVAARKS